MELRSKHSNDNIQDSLDCFLVKSPLSKIEITAVFMLALELNSFCLCDFISIILTGTIDQTGHPVKMAKMIILTAALPTAFLKAMPLTEAKLSPQRQGSEHFPPSQSNVFLSMYLHLNWIEKVYQRRKKMEKKASQQIKLISFIHVTFRMTKSAILLPNMWDFHFWKPFGTLLIF